MGGGGKGGAGKEAEFARAQEKERQDKIRAGTARINSIFDGSLAGVGKLDAGATYDPNRLYYMSTGDLWTPPAAYTTTVYDDTSAPGQPQNPAQSREEATKRSAAAGGVDSFSAKDRATTGYFDGANAMTGNRGGPVTTRTSSDNTGGNFSSNDSTRNGRQVTVDPSSSAFAEALAGGLYGDREYRGGFNDDFFRKRRQAYLDYAEPQLDRQYGSAQKELTFALDRQGLLNSSTRSQEAGDLQSLYDTRKREVSDQALSYENEARNAAESARADLVQMLNATGDVESTVNSAISRSEALSQPDTYSPLGQLFTDFTSTLGTQAAQERAAALSGGSYTTPLSTGIFAPRGRIQVKA